VDPAGAIQQYKVKAALEWVKGLVVPWGGKDARENQSAAAD